MGWLIAALIVGALLGLGWAMDRRDRSVGSQTRGSGDINRVTRDLRRDGRALHSTPMVGRIRRPKR